MPCSMWRNDMNRRIDRTMSRVFLVTVGVITVSILAGCGQSGTSPAAVGSDLRSTVESVAKARQACEEQIARVEDQLAALNPSRVHSPRLAAPFV
jgi:hypothetical protein